MEPFQYHVYVCDQQKPEGVPCCTERGSRGMIEELRREIVTQGLANDVQITTCGSLGLCERGPNLVVYPEGVWYSGVRAEDVREIVDSHFRQGRPVSRLVNTDQIDQTFDRPVALHCIGGFAIAMLHGLPRPTVDVDCLMVIPVEETAPLQLLAGEGSALHKKYGVYGSYPKSVTTLEAL
jgi:(2Fe-2S) ferredoxin